MTFRSFLRVALAGAAIVLAVLLALAAYRSLTADPQPRGDFDPADFVRPQPRLDAPYVPTDYAVVDAMLAMAGVKPNDHVIDLGSGDGRILIAAARSHGAHGLGIEIDPARIREAEANAQAARVTHLVEFRRQDLFETPLEEADVVTLYLTQEVNLRLRPRILSQMRPGSRVVSHDYDMGDWNPDGRQRIGSSTLYLWIVPAQVGGRWRLQVDGRTATLDLEQNYQRLQGTVGLDGSSRPILQGSIAGRRIRFVADAGDGRRVFEGRVAEGRIVPLQADAGWQAVRAG